MGGGMSTRLDTARERWLRERRYAQTTKSTYRDTLRALERRIPGVYLEHIRSEELIDFLLYDDDGQPTRRAGSTLMRQRATLCSFFGWCHRKGLIRVDPATELLALKLGRDNRRPGKWLTHDERVNALDLVRSCQFDNRWRDEALLLVALLTGLRRAELADLTWGEVDLQQRRVVVQGKGGFVRTIGLPDRGATALRHWLKFHRERRGRHPSPGDPVFCTGHQHGGINGGVDGYTFTWHKPLTKWAVYGIVQRYAGCATHDLRRTFAGMLDEKGVALQGIQAALRHASPAVTVACYLDKSPKRAIEAVEDLDI
jgi:integrase